MNPHRRPGAYAAALLLAAAACNDPIRGPIGVESDRHPGPPHRGGWLHLASYTDVRSLDSAIAFDEIASAVEQLLYAKLLDFAPSGRGFVPDLAERWTVSDDGLTYAFFLRRGALFHDGSEVRAADVKRSLERTLSPDTPCPASAFYERISGYKAYASRKAPELSGVRVAGDYALEITLDEPDATLLAVLALPFAAPVCRSAGRSYDREFSRHVCAAGPFRLASWEPGRAVRAARFEGYYDRSMPYLDGVEYQFAVPNFTQRFKFEGGSLDYMREFSISDLARYQGSALWAGRGAWEPSKALHSIFMNTEMQPFRNPELRRAVSAAINRDEIAAIWPGAIVPATRLIPAAIAGHDPSPGQRFDLPAALLHMRKAGYPFDPATGRGGYPDELTYITVSDSFEAQAAQVYQQHLARIGIRFRIRALGWPAYLADSSRRGVAAFGADGWSADFPDPGDFFEPILSSRAISDEESQNRSFYSNKAFDDLLDRARRETRWEQRLALYREAEQMVIDDAPWAITYTKRWFEIWHPYVHDYRIHPFLTEHVGVAWIDEAARARALQARAAFPLSRGRLAAWFSGMRGRL